VEIIAVTGDAPTRPFARHLRRSHGCRIPAGVGITNVITRIWSGAVRSRERVIRLRAGGGDQSPRKEPAIAKAIVDTPQQGVLASDTCRVFGTTPAARPVWGFSVPQRSFKLRTIQLRIHLVSVSQRSLELSTEPRDVSVSGLATKLTRGPVPRLWRQAVSRRKTPALTGVR